MQVSVIPPFSELSWAERGADAYHLTLAFEALQSDEYADFYRNLSQKGHYVFLDNSAHELGSGMSVDKLLLAAERVGAVEMILPDRLFFGDDTLEMSETALREIRRQNRQIRLMGVPQGRTIEEWTSTLSGLLGMGISCIGISKDYEVWPGGLHGLVQRVRAWSKTVDIHLLGFGRDPEQLFYIARDPGMSVRGVDSTKPFVYALNGIRMSRPERSVWTKTVDLSQPPYPRRKLDYFHESFADVPQELIRFNINVFRHYAGALDI